MNERGQRIAELYKGGLTMAQVAVEMGLSRTRVGQILRAQGLTSGKIGAPKRYHRLFVCAQCGGEFESRYPGKRFCTLQCYHDSPQWAQQLKNHVERQKEVARLSVGLKPDEDPSIVCLNCNQIKKVGVWLLRGSVRPKYCSRRCYREYLAKRFDRYIANPQSLALPQNYDEFLLSEELECLVEGCAWSGENLARHVNLAHGITAEQFKRLAGFNITTGLVTADLSEKMSARQIGNGFNADWMALIGENVEKRPGGPYRSLEGREHRRKAQALIESPVRDVECRGCGITFQTTAAIKFYCSVECRDDYYKRRKSNVPATELQPSPKSDDPPN